MRRSTKHAVLIVSIAIAIAASTSYGYHVLVRPKQQPPGWTEYVNGR